MVMWKEGMHKCANLYSCIYLSSQNRWNVSSFLTFLQNMKCLPWMLSLIRKHLHSMWCYGVQFSCRDMSLMSFESMNVLPRRIMLWNARGVMNSCGFQVRMLHYYYTYKTQIMALPVNNSEEKVWREGLEGRSGARQADLLQVLKNQTWNLPSGTQTLWEIQLTLIEPRFSKHVNNQGGGLKWPQPKCFCFSVIFHRN